MNFEYNEDQLVLKDSVSKYLQDNYEFESRQKIVNSNEPFSSQIWSECADLGWLYMPFTEQQGGIGGTPVDTMLLFEELGRFLVIEPFLETMVLVGGILKRVPSEFSADKIEALMAGQLQGALAHFEAASRGEISNIEATALNLEDGYSINGRKSVVYNAQQADLLFVTAKLSESGDIGIFALSKEDFSKIKLRAYPTVDGRSAADIDLIDIHVNQSQLISSGAAAIEILEEVFDEAHLALASEMVGAMDELLKATVEYTKERKQFGTTLSSFQVLQHTMADMFMAKELARSLMYAAAIKLRDGSPDARSFVAAAKVKADLSAKQVAHGAIQLHGGIATTDELNVGHYLKRITVASQIFGNTGFHLKRYANSAL